MVTIRRLATHELRPSEIEAIRAIMTAAWPDPDEGFTDDDWAHGLGGLHVLAEEDGEIVAHASVVEREIHVAGRPLRTGYVEAVATRPDHENRGIGSAVMEAIDEHIDATYELGALGTGRLSFYERLGWVRWRGPTSVRTADGEQRTPDEDGFVMVRRTPTSPPLDLDAPISCDWRTGDVW